MKRLLTVWNVSPLPHPNTTTSNPCHSFFFHSFLITCVCVCVHIFDVISFLVWKTGEEHVRRKRNGQRRCDGGGGWKRSGWIVGGQRSSTGGRFESGAGRRRRWRIEIAIGIAGAHVGLCPWLLLQPARRCLLATGNAFPGGHERRPIQLLERPAIRRVSHKSIWFTYHGVGERKNTIDINIFWNALRPYGIAAAATLVVVPLTASFDVECNISPDAIWLKFAFLASSSFLLLGISFFFVYRQSILGRLICVSIDWVPVVSSTGQMRIGRLACRCRRERKREETLFGCLDMVANMAGTNSSLWRQ